MRLCALTILVVTASCGRLQFDAVDAVDAVDAPTTIALLQDANEIDLGLTSASVSFTTPPSPGDFVWVSVVSADSHAISGVTDNQGNIYAEAFVAQVSGCATIGVWGYFARDVRSTGTFTVSATGSAVWGIHLREYSGSPVLEQTMVGNGIGALADSGPVQVTARNSLAIAAQTHCEPLSTGAGAGWGDHVVTTEDQLYQAFSTEDMIDPPLGTYDGTFTYTPMETLGWAVGVAILAP